MRLHASILLPFPREEVYAAYRDHITEVLEFLPNVRAIELKSRQEGDSLVHQIHEWHGGGEVPSAMRGVITESMLGWTGHAIWSLEHFLCDWKVESHKFAHLLRCEGRSAFITEASGETLLEVRGTVEVDGRRLPGVPPHLARPVARSVEDFLAAKIESNARSTLQWFDKHRSVLRVKPSTDA